MSPLASECTHTAFAWPTRHIYIQHCAHTAEMDDNILSKKRNDVVSHKLQGSRAMCLMRHSHQRVGKLQNKNTGGSNKCLQHLKRSTEGWKEERNKSELRFLQWGTSPGDRGQSTLKGQPHLSTHTYYTVSFLLLLKIQILMVSDTPL